MVLNFKGFTTMLALLFTASFAWAQQFAPTTGYTADLRVPTSKNEFKIMSYNVLNLFDALHDEGKLDHTFLPLSYPGKAVNCQRLSSSYYREECLRLHWTNDKIGLKLQQIAKVIQLQGTLPDMLALQEVENENVIRMLAQYLGYQNFVVTNSPDRRGIDVALLFNQDKLEYLEHQEIDVSSTVGFATRNILRVHFRPKVGSKKSRKTIGVYVNHWPSQAKGAINRYTAAQILAQNIELHTNNLGAENYYVIATGDFNTIDRDSPHPFYDMIVSPVQWNNFLYDSEVLSKRARNPMTYYMPPGTYWYEREGSWSTFDRIFISQNLWTQEGMSLDAKSFRILGSNMNSVRIEYDGRTPDYYPAQQLVPWRYNYNTSNERELGFSDHYPVVVKFKVK